MAEVAIEMDWEGIMANWSSLEAMPKEATVSVPKVLMMELTTKAPMETTDIWTPEGMPIWIVFKVRSLSNLNSFRFMRNMCPCLFRYHAAAMKEIPGLWW